MARFMSAISIPGPCPEPNHALICYRRKDAQFAAALSRRLKDYYGIDCFRDEDSHKFGAEWRPCWRQQLDLRDPRTPDAGPSVIVLATDAAAEPRPSGEDVVVEEIWEALPPTPAARRNHLVVLKFGTKGWVELSRRLEEKGRAEGRPDVVKHIDNHLHQPGVFDASLLLQPELTDRQWNEICRPIVVSVRSYFLDILRKERTATLEWADRILSNRLSAAAGRDVFTRQGSRLHLDGSIGRLAGDPEKRAVIAVGPGGVGKTTQVALSLQAVLGRPEDVPFFPVVLSNEEINDLDATLRKRLGLTWLSGDRPVSLSDEGLQWFADKLCFVTDSLERTDSVEATARQLERLRGVAKLLITCRPEAWSKAADHLLVEKGDVTVLGLIGDTDVQNYLGIARPADVASRPYLRNPVFLDIAAHLTRAGEAAFTGGRLASETELLDAFRAFGKRPPEGRPGTERERLRTGCERFLKNLAREQLAHNRFDVPRQAFGDSGYEDAIAHLVEHGKYAILEGGNDSGVRIRLRHDVIDAHNIANLLQDDPKLFSQVLGSPEHKGKLHLGFGQLLFEGVAQAAHDRGRRDVIEAFFLEFLRLVDNKQYPDQDFKAAGWNSGYVITARFRAFAHVVKAAIAGRYLGDTRPNGPEERLSGLDGLTQNAMSSVSSMLGGQNALSIDDPDGALLRALEEKIYTIRLRGRLIEGLAKIARPDEAMALLSGLAGNSNLIRDDAGLVRYIARAIKDAGGASREHSGQALKALANLRHTFQQIFPDRYPSILRDIERAERQVADLRARRAAACPDFRDKRRPGARDPRCPAPAGSPAVAAGAGAALPIRSRAAAGDRVPFQDCRQATGRRARRIVGRMWSTWRCPGYGPICGVEALHRASAHGRGAHGIAAVPARLALRRSAPPRGGRRAGEEDCLPPLCRWRRDAAFCELILAVAAPVAYRAGAARRILREDCASREMSGTRLR